MNAPDRGMLRFMNASRVIRSPVLLDDPTDSVLESVGANRFTLILGCLAAIVFGFIGVLLTGMVRVNRAPSPLMGWVVLTLSAVILVVTVRQLLWPVPLGEVTCRGVRLRVAAPMLRSGLLFVPWSRVRAVVFTQTVVTNLKGGGREDALGFQIDQDESFRLPEVKWNSSHAAPEAPKCDVVFAASMISGDVRECVRKIEEQRILAKTR